jgi:sugar fermentation stimulation protein A
VDSQAPNRVFSEWLTRQPELSRAEFFPEHTFGDSRLDFLFRLDSIDYLIEIKGVTLEKNGIGCFPDAPTDRGTKHLRNLIHAAGQGYKCCVVFVTQMEDVRCVVPNRDTDPLFTRALCDAQASGVFLSGYVCHVTPHVLEIKGPIPVDTSLSAWEDYCRG